MPWLLPDGLPPNKDDLAELPVVLPSILLFAVTWSVGATCDKAGRVTFDAWLRKKVLTLQNAAPAIIQAGLDGEALSDQQILEAFQRLASGMMPETAGVYEWCFQQDTKQWAPWMSTIPEFRCDPDMPFSQITVPTADTVRYSFLLDVLLAAGKHVLCVGDTGTGKTLTVVNKLLGAMPPEVQPSFMTFSARTSANQTQDIIGTCLCPGSLCELRTPTLVLLFLHIFWGCAVPANSC
jgi:dynein heavy chain